MRVLLIIFAIFTFGHSQLYSEEEDISVTSIKDDINKLIEELRTNIPEPIAISKYDLDFTGNDVLSGDLELDDVKLTGLKGFDMNIKYIFLIPKSFILNFDYIDLNLKYISDLQLLNQPLLSIFGEGTTLIGLTNLTITGKINYSLSPLNLTIYSMGLDLTSARFLFNGLLNDQDFTDTVNVYLNTNFVRLFNTYSGQIGSTVEDVINTIISEILNGNSTVGLDYENVQDNNIYNEDSIQYEAKAFGKMFQTLVEWIASIVN